MVSEKHLRCNPYSQTACENAVKRLGLELGGNGYKFADKHSTKGCYAYDDEKYKGMAYFGIGGSELDMKKALEKPMFRPRGYDCLGLGNNSSLY